MAASCRRAAQARLWNDFFKEPSLWRDNRSTKTNSRAPDFLHKLTNQPLWLESWFNPSWVHDKFKLQKCVEPFATQAQQNCLLLNLPQDGRSACSNTLPSPLHAVQMPGDIPISCHDATQAHNDMLVSHGNAVPICIDMFDSEENVPPQMQMQKHVLSTCMDDAHTYGSNKPHILALPLDPHQQLMSSDDLKEWAPSSRSWRLPHEKIADLLRKCREEKDSSCALQLHHYMHRYGLDLDTSLGNHLVAVLADVGSLCHAQQVFDKLKCQHECSWNALITGYVKCRESQHALDVYQKMQASTSLHPSATTFVALLKACTVLKDLQMGERVYADIDKGLLEKDVFVGSTLINMFAKCGCLAKAQEVFDMLQVQNVVSWNALIAGYVEYGYSEEGLVYYDKMYSCGISPDAITLVCILKACGSKGDLLKGREVHAEIVWKGFLENDTFISSSLVDMYAKCSSLAEAQAVFNLLPHRNVVAWNALISGYAEHNSNGKALECLEQMQHNAISPDAVTLLCSLKACASIGAGVKAQGIHAEVAMKGLLDRDMFLGSTLVDAYAKCGWLADAESVFASFPVRDVVLWNALISGYTEHGLCEEALKRLDQMHCEGMSPNAATLICSLKACSSIGALVQGQDLHVEIVKRGWLEEDPFLGSSLVYLYAKCGLCIEAESVLERLPEKDVVSWNALLAGYAEGRLGDEALQHFKLMQVKSIVPDAVTFTCILKACTSIGAIVRGREIHIEVSKKGLLDNDVGNALIDMYAKCFALTDAQSVFSELPGQNVISLNTLLSGYVECGHEGQALKVSGQVQQGGILTDAVTLVCSLKACGAIKAIVEGQRLHSEILCRGLEQELLVGNTLVDYYCKCGLFAEAQKSFQKCKTRDIVAWTALIGGYVEYGCDEEALHCFEQMQDEGVCWDAVTFVFGLTACGNARTTIEGETLYGEAIKKGLLETEVPVGGPLVDMYAKFGSISEAEKVFYNLPVRDIGSWNALIAGYVDLGCGKEALGLLEQMWQEGILSDTSTLVCGLKACSIMGATDRGQEIHSEIAEKGLDGELLMGNTLVDMYVKCGVLAGAQGAFDKLLFRDLVSWNTLISGYGQRGQIENVFLNLHKMSGEGMIPDLVTFSSILNACSHAGLVERGQMYFEAMKSDCRFIPTLEHYTCIVDILGRAGQVEKAMAVIHKMPLHPGIVAWHSLLGACQKWGNLNFGKYAFENVVGLDESDAAAYVCMCNIYANAAMNEEL